VALTGGRAPGGCAPLARSEHFPSPSRGAPHASPCLPYTTPALASPRARPGATGNLLAVHCPASRRWAAALVLTLPSVAPRSRARSRTWSPRSAAARPGVQPQTCVDVHLPDPCYLSLVHRAPRAKAGLTVTPVFSVKWRAKVTLINPAPPPTARSYCHRAGPAAEIGLSSGPRRGGEGQHRPLSPAGKHDAGANGQAAVQHLNGNGSVTCVRRQRVTMAKEFSPRILSNNARRRAGPQPDHGHRTADQRRAMTARSRAVDLRPRWRGAHLREAEGGAGRAVPLMLWARSAPLSSCAMTRATTYHGLLQAQRLVQGGRLLLKTNWRCAAGRRPSSSSL